jgi:hypothetical protein
MIFPISFGYMKGVVIQVSKTLKTIRKIVNTITVKEIACLGKAPC